VTSQGSDGDADVGEEAGEGAQPRGRGERGGAHGKRETRAREGAAERARKEAAEGLQIQILKRPSPQIEHGAKVGAGGGTQDILDGDEESEQAGAVASSSSAGAALSSFSIPLLSDGRPNLAKFGRGAAATRARARAVREALAAAEALAAVAVASAGGGGAVQEVSRGNLIMGSGFQFDMVPIVDVLNAS
jgi:hypothetical protein